MSAAVRVVVPTQLRGYTGGAAEVRAAGATLAAVLADLDRQFPGLRFRVIDEQGRIREHMRVFVDGERVREIGAKVGPKAEVHVFGALSGG